MSTTSEQLCCAETGFATVDSSPVHLLVLVAAVLLLALTVVMIVVLWQDRDLTVLEKAVWSMIALLFPVLGTVSVGTALVWHRIRSVKRREPPA